LFIQQLYCLSDEQLERELADRISFRIDHEVNDRTATRKSMPSSSSRRSS
jgi:IS5 family transposase